MTPIERTELNLIEENNKNSISNFIYKSIPDSLDSCLNSFKKLHQSRKIYSKDEIILSNIHPQSSDKEILKFISQFVKVVKVNIKKNKIKTKKGGYKIKNKGICYVKFSDSVDLEKLLIHNGKHLLRGRYIYFKEFYRKTQSLEDIEKRCWFCFSNPNIERHLILYNFQHFYLAYPKGPIDLFHILIIPKFHIKNYLEITPDLDLELNFITNTLRKFFIDNSLEYIIYERSLPYKIEQQKHMILNFVGIPKDLSFCVFDNFTAFFKREKVKYNSYNTNEWKIFDAKKMINSREKNIDIDEIYYNYIEIPTGINLGKSEKRMRLFIPHVKNDHKYFVDFVRYVICDIIQKKGNNNWKVILNFFCLDFFQIIYLLLGL